jgi:hypothetical protein
VNSLWVFNQAGGEGVDVTVNYDVLLFDFPNRSWQVVHVHFAPKRRGPLSLRVPVVFWRVRGIKNAASTMETGLGSGIAPIRPSSTLAAPEAILQRAVLSVHGAGTGGLVRFEPEVVDFGTLLVGSEVRRVLFLINDSDCCMFYRMDSR